MASNPISIPELPTSPNIGYYNSSKNDIYNKTGNTDPNDSYYPNLTENLKNSCSAPNSGSWNNTDGIYSLIPSEENDDSFLYVPNNVSNSLDIPFYLAKSGVLMNNPTYKSDSLKNKIDLKCESSRGKQQITNQIQYLTCQLENERNRVYDSNSFTLFTHADSVGDMFKKFKNMKPYFIIIFIISMYILVSGFFGSMDLTVNIFRGIEKNSNADYQYWIGLLLGLATPIIVLCVMYSTIVCKNLTFLEKYDISTNPYGKKEEIPSDLKKFDIVTLVLFILLIYAFVAVLFTIKESILGIHIYTSLVGLILFIISIFIYVLYIYVPFFNTNSDKIEMVNNKPQSLHLFIDQQQTPSNISTNQYEITNIRKVFVYTFIVIFIMAILFFTVIKKESNRFFSGFLGSSAILILPLLWVLNFVIGFNYFYIYPMLFIIIRFIRYILMSLVYIISEKNNSFKDNFSSDLLEQLNNFKNYSPSWGLIGVDEFKLFLNIIGFENSFSKIIVPDNNTKNISQNKFLASGTLGFLVEFIAGTGDNKNGIIYSIVIFVITIILSLILLASVKAIP
jgi:hypothetical protein